MTWTPVIGLEMHARLHTRSKLFCGCANDAMAAANTLTCAVCSGLPGSMPVLNGAAFERAARAVLALEGRLAAVTRFDRKSYFYPDLPKGYQITQVDAPLGRGGSLPYVLGGEEHAVPLERLHLEEDAGKSLHEGEHTLLDLNRAGVPLIEVVTEPALHSGAAAAACVRALRQLLRVLDIGDGDMEKGSLRCDVNVSMRRPGHPLGAAKVEVKNLNSFRAVEAAVDAEIARQTSLLESGQEVRAETRLWDAAQRRTAAARLKEDAARYAYQPEVDVGAVALEAGWIAVQRQRLPELPQQRRQRWRQHYALSPDVLEQLTQEEDVAAFFEATVAAGAAARPVANWMCNDLVAILEACDSSLSGSALEPRSFAGLMALRQEGRVSQAQARQVLEVMVQRGGDAARIAADNGWNLDEPEDLAAVIGGVVAEHAEVVQRWRTGRAGALDFLVGQVMRRLQGRVDAARVRTLFLEALQSPGDGVAPPDDETKA